MVYNKACQYSVMFGGQGHTNEMLRDTWIYADGQWWEWQKRWWKRRPPARCGHSLTYDANIAKVVLFGGIDPNDQPLGDTWLFDGDSWRAVTGPAPPARRYAAFAYDPDLKGCVLHGGAEDDQGQRYFGDAWLFRAGTWQPLGQLFETNGRDDHGLAYHFAAHRLVMLGGLTGGQEVAVREDSGWQKAIVHPLHPRHQCSPLGSVLK